MNRRMNELFEGSDSRYLDRDEMKEILAYTNTLPGRFKAAVQVEQKEAEAVGVCVERMRKLYPNLEKFHHGGWDKAYRDIQLTVRYMAQSMILDDPTVMEDKLLFWMRSMLSGVDLTPKFVSDTYTILRDAYKEVLPEECYKLMEPYFDRACAVLSDIPEPATPSV